MHEIIILFYIFSTDKVQVVAFDVPPAGDILACQRQFTIFHTSLPNREPTQP